MSEHVGFIVKVEHLRPHSNADRLQVATFFGNDTCVDLKVKVGDFGIYFPTDLQLSEEFCEQNNLVRKKDASGQNIGGYMDPNKRNVTTIRLRGEKSDGLYLPIRCLEYTGIDIVTLTPGMTIDVVNGHEICRKFIPAAASVKGTQKQGNRTRKKKAPIAPLFAEHADTEQLNYNLDAFHPGDQIEITLKMHGTSQRTGYLPVLKKYKRSLFDRIFRREGTPIYEYDYVSGTRRTVLETYEGGYYGDDTFRKIHSDKFTGKLHKGETVYYEVVGFTTNGTPIMSPGDNNKTKDKEFIKSYGPTTVFSYGCNPKGKETHYYRDDVGIYSIEEEVPQSDLYVYRMTLTTEEGHVVEYSLDYMRYRCEQIGVKCVPVFWQGYIPFDGDETGRVRVFSGDSFNWTTPGEYVKYLAEQFYDGPDPVGKTHIREGVVVRIVNRPKFTAYKTKNFYFKALEGVIKEAAVTPDMEEVEELIN